MNNGPLSTIRTNMPRWTNYANVGSAPAEFKEVLDALIMTLMIVEALERGVQRSLAEARLWKSRAILEPTDQPITSHDEWVEEHEASLETEHEAFLAKHASRMHTLSDAERAGEMAYKPDNGTYDEVYMAWRASLTSTSLSERELSWAFKHGYMNKALFVAVEAQLNKEAADYDKDVRDSQHPI